MTGVGLKMFVRRSARLHRRAGEERADRLLGAAAEVAAEDRVAGERDDEQTARRGSARRRCARSTVGVRRSWAPERISVGTSGRRSLGRRRGRGVGPARADRHEARAQRRARVERVEVAARACRAARRALRPAASARRRSAATGTGAPRRRCRRTAFRRSTPSFRPAVCRARSGSGPPRAASGAAAGRDRGAAPRRPPPAAARAAPGCRSPACRIPSRPVSSSLPAWRRPEPS